MFAVFQGQRDSVQVEPKYVPQVTKSMSVYFFLFARLGGIHF